jgi:hypothetical protein
MINFAINRERITSTQLENISVELTGLLNLLSTPTVTPDKLNVGYFLRCTGTLRGNSTVDDNANLLILDGDSRYCHDGEIHNGAVNPDLIHELLTDFKINHVIYTSHSNDVDLHKYRVVIPCNYHRNQLDALLWRVFSRLHENEINLVDSKENHAFSHAWFMPSYPPERADLFKVYSYLGGTRGLDVERITADYQKHLAWLESLKPEISKVPVMARPMPTDSQNPIDVFNASFSVHDILIRNGYTKVGKRYLHPNSQSKIAGVRILDNGRVYSDSNDALNDGKAHDCWDVYRLLECGGDMRQALNWNAELTKENQRAFYAN